MFEIIKIKINQGRQTIKDIKKAAVNEKHRGLPVINCGDSCKNCDECQKICPTGAIFPDPAAIDMGKCVFCGDCARKCPANAIKFTDYYKLAATSRENLIVTGNKNDFEKFAVQARKEIKDKFGRSLKLRSVSAGGCNGCEMELNACSNVNFDMGRFGIEFAASPRHCDGLVITGPVTENMAQPLEDTFLSIPDPKIIIAAGTCAISGGIFSNSKALNRDFFKKYNVDLYIPGCPPHPLTFINGILSFLGK
jgi:Ni,Fe-hydrogenase III small subunit/NAD-dependent dihydropyrimidine dehydrogenase PreA subunit